MPESDGLRLGKVAVSRVFRDEARLRGFLKQATSLRISLETCEFTQVESVVRELSPPAAAIPRGGQVVVSYQGLPDNENEVLEQFFRQELKEAKAKHPNLFK